MSNILLSSLYQERFDLTTKLNYISQLIEIYTKAPQEPLPDPVQNPPPLIEPKPVDTIPVKAQVSQLPTYNGYPNSGQWKHKILYALKEIGTPSTSKDIAAFMCGAEANDDFGTMLRTTTTYLSSLAKEGEIGVDASEYRHKYFLKS